MLDSARQRRRDGQGLDRSFAAELDSVAQARRLVTGWLGESHLGQDRLIGDIAQAVSEACNNAVLHAYRTSEGTGDGKAFRLVAERGDTIVTVTVSDDGGGMTPRADSPGLGLGLPLITMLCDDVAIGPPATGTGTVVAMRFAASATPAAGRPGPSGPRRRGSSATPSG